MPNNSGLHHYHIRKRIFKNRDKYPSKDKIKRTMDHLIYFVAIFGPIMTLPQIWKIWVDKSVSGVSLITWSAYLITACLWLTYGIIHREKPIIVSNILWLILKLSVVVGVILYN